MSDTLASIVGPREQVATAREWLEHEAWLLDDRQFGDWLELIHPEVRYLVPSRFNVLPAAEADFTSWHPTEELGGDLDIPIADDDFESLRLRVERLASGLAWAEWPPSLTRRLIGGVRIRPPHPDEDDSVEGPKICIASVFHLHQDHPQHGAALLAGQRHDTLAEHDGALRLLRRTVILDHTVLPTSTLTIFL